MKSLYYHLSMTDFEKWKGDEKNAPLKGRDESVLLQLYLSDVLRGLFKDVEGEYHRTGVVVLGDNGDLRFYLFDPGEGMAVLHTLHQHKDKKDQTAYLFHLDRIDALANLAPQPPLHTSGALSTEPVRPEPITPL